jgi:glycosyltransferase involved in cell wall biosynthesis
MTSPPIVDVLIPAFNEGRAIGKVIRSIPGHLVRRIIVCNNNSTDDTSAEALKAGALVTHQPRKGYGSACLAGMAYIENGHPIDPPDIVVFMDGDYSDHPDELPRLLEPITAGTDMVIGSRTLGCSERGSLTIPQQFGNWLATRMIRLMYGFRFTDLGPFRAIRWDKLKMLHMNDRDFGWTVEMQVKAVKHKLVCMEVPVSYRKRIGKSKISGTVKGTFLAGYKILWTILRYH